jgi:colanic acid/amylovoran biosynthesis protein
MRIVVEPGSYGCHNMGDVAMMQIAVARLRELWPHAEIAVLTSRPDLLSRYCPSAFPVSVEARNAWLSGRSLITSFCQNLPGRISAPLQRLERWLWLRFPVVTELEVCFKAAVLRRANPTPARFRKQLTDAGLVVMSGAGALNDAFADSACPLLDEIEFVLQAGVPVVAFGRGIGPITEPALLAKARAVLPRLKLIGLREGIAGLPFLESLGVPRDRIYITGDDAIELAHRHRPSLIGNAIGVNLRLAGYAGTGEDMVGKLRGPLMFAAKALNSFLLSVPISFHESDSDVDATRKLLDGESHSSQATIESPEDVIRLIGNCRVVVTGSYHGGVFALAQGIPVVGLVHSRYYEQKFAGLQEQFPGGCHILDFRRPITSGEIQKTILDAWDSAGQVKESLLTAANHQIELSRAAYKTARCLFPPEDDVTETASR